MFDYVIGELFGAILVVRFIRVQFDSPDKKRYQVVLVTTIDGLKVF